MKWSIKVGKILGIAVYLHFTFLLLLAFLGFVTWRSTGRVDSALGGVAFIAALQGRLETTHNLLTNLHESKTRDAADGATLSDDHPGLTSRESEVLQLVAEGFANKQIADELGISIKPVEKHRQHLMNKLDIHETAGLTRFAIDTGVVESRFRSTYAPWRAVGACSVSEG